MPLALLNDTDFSGLADWLESPGDPAGQPVDGTQYVNPAGYSNGNNWRITSGQLCGNGFNDTSYWCGLPAATYHARAGRYVGRLTNAGTLSYILLVKVSGTKAYAVSVQDNTSLTGQVRVSIGPIDTNLAGFTAATDTSFTTSKTGMAAMWAVVDFSEPDNAHTSITVVVYDGADVASFNASTGTVTLNGGASAIGTATLTNDATAGYQNVDGGFAVTSQANGYGYTRLAAYSSSVPPSFTISPPAPGHVEAQRAHNALILTGSSTAWTTSTTFSVSGVSGVSIESQRVDANAQVACLNVATGSGTGTVTVSNNTDAATATFTVGPVLLQAKPSLSTMIPVSQRCSMPLPVLGTSFASPGVLFQDRIPIVSGCTAIRLVYANPTDTAFDLRASVKVGTGGTLHRVTFTDPTTGTSGLTQITLPPYSRRISDALTLAVPQSSIADDGTADDANNLFVRTWVPLSATQTIKGTRLRQGNATPGGNHQGYYATGSDDTLSAGADASLIDNGAIYGPSLVLGAASNMALPCAIVWGDSIIQDGTGFGAFNNACAALGIASIHLAAQATNTQYLLNAAASIGDVRDTQLWTAWAEWATDAVCQHSHNDVSGATPHTVENMRGLIVNLRAIRGFLPNGCTYYVTTGTPSTTKLAGAWSTITEGQQQTASGSYNTQDYNEWLRSQGPGLVWANHFIDLAADAETSPSSMKWNTGDLTVDGVHPGGGLAAPWKARFVAELTPTSRDTAASGPGTPATGNLNRLLNGL